MGFLWFSPLQGLHNSSRQLRPSLFFAGLGCVTGPTRRIGKLNPSPGISRVSRVQHRKLNSQSPSGYSLYAASQSDPEIPFSFRFSVLYSARNRLIWLVQPSIFFEACLTPTGYPVSSQVHVHCESTAHAHRPQICFNFKTVLVSTCSLGLSSISKRPTSDSTHVLSPLDLPKVYLQKVACLKQEQHFTLALSDDAVDTPFLKKDCDQILFRIWGTPLHLTMKALASMLVPPHMQPLRVSASRQVISPRFVCVDDIEVRTNPAGFALCGCDNLE